MSEAAKVEQLHKEDKPSEAERDSNPANDAPATLAKPQETDKKKVEEEAKDALGGDETMGTVTKAFVEKRDLQNYLSRNLNDFEPGLTVYEDEDGVDGVDFPAARRTLDILATDKDGDLVVLVLRVGEAADDALGQIAHDLAWVKRNAANPGQRVRAAIVANGATEDLKLAASEIQNLTLITYKMQLTFSRA